MRRRLVASTVFAVILAAVVSCDDSPGKPSPVSPSAAASPQASQNPFAELDPLIGALDTVLLFCTPGFPGSPRDGCDSGRIRTSIDKLVDGLRSAPSAGQDPASRERVSSAADALHRSAAGLRQCEAYFDRGEGEAECSSAWLALNADWAEVKAATGW